MSLELNHQFAHSYPGIPTLLPSPLHASSCTLGCWGYQPCSHPGGREAETKLGLRPRTLGQFKHPSQWLCFQWPGSPNTLEALHPGVSQLCVHGWVLCRPLESPILSSSPGHCNAPKSIYCIVLHHLLSIQMVSSKSCPLLSQLLEETKGSELPGAVPWQVGCDVGKIHVPYRKVHVRVNGEKGCNVAWGQPNLRGLVWAPSQHLGKHMRVGDQAVMPLWNAFPALTSSQCRCFWGQTRSLCIRIFSIFFPWLWPSLFEATHLATRDTAGIVWKPHCCP